MTLRTGTSRSGRVHRYYACSTSARVGRSACKGRSIRMDTLDTVVTSQLIDRLFSPDRLREMLTELMERRAKKSIEVDARVQVLEAKAVDADQRLRRLYALVEDGQSDLDDLLKKRISALRLDRQIAHETLERARGSRRGQIMLDASRIDSFARLMRERLTTGAIPFRKAYLGSIIDRVEVDDDRIRIFGRKDVLEQALVAGAGNASPGVRTSVRRWRTRRDSNPWPLPSEGSALSS